MPYTRVTARNQQWLVLLAVDVFTIPENVNVLVPYIITTRDAT